MVVVGADEPTGFELVHEVTEFCALGGGIPADRVVEVPADQDQVSGAAQELLVMLHRRATSPVPPRRLVAVSPVVHVPDREQSNVCRSGQVDWHDPLVSGVEAVVDTQLPAPKGHHRESLVRVAANPLHGRRAYLLQRLPGLVGARGLG